MELKKLNRKVQTEAEFKERNKFLQRQLRHQYLNLAKNPTGISVNITEILDTMSEEGIITPEFKNKQLQHMFSELNSPNEFKMWCSEQAEKGKIKIQDFRKKAKEFLTKKFK
jgi:hypothetical protein